MSKYISYYVGGILNACFLLKLYIFYSMYCLQKSMVYLRKALHKFLHLCMP